MGRIEGTFGYATGMCWGTHRERIGGATGAFETEKNLSNRAGESISLGHPTWLLGLVDCLNFSALCSSVLQLVNQKLSIQGSHCVCLKRINALVSLMLIGRLLQNFQPASRIKSRINERLLDRCWKHFVSEAILMALDKIENQ